MKSLNKTSEILLHELELETNIRKELPEVHLYFDYEEDDDGMTELSVVTISKTHGERFLFHKVLAPSREKSLKKMMAFVQSNYKKNSEHYEIVWTKKGTGSSQKSWFYGTSFLDVIDKFFYMKDTSEIQIFSIIMSPIS
jgi:hypothetical protein